MVAKGERAGRMDEKGNKKYKLAVINYISYRDVVYSTGNMSIL